MNRIKHVITVGRDRNFLLPLVIYIVIAIFFLFNLLISNGDVAQQDWGIPITASAAFRDFYSRLFVWDYNGFGSHGLFWGFPFFTLTNAVLAPFGFVGGVEIKLLAVSLVAFGGITAYLLGRSFRLGKLSSFLAGLFFMTTPVVFNWLMFGWIFYLLSYDLLPIMILATKRFIETNDLRYALFNGLILSIATIQPTFILVFPLLGFLFVLFESNGRLAVIRRGLTLAAISLLVWFLTSLTFFTSHTTGEALSFYYGDFFNAIQWQFKNFSSLLNPIRLWGSTMNFQFGTYFPQDLILMSFMPIIVASVVILLRPTSKRVLFLSFSYLFAFLAYYVYDNLYFLVFNLPYGAIFQAPSIFLAPAGLGLALLIGYAHDSFSGFCANFRRLFSRSLFKYGCFIAILVIVVSAGYPWWSGQVSGEPISGPPTKLNLYEIPSSYKEWQNVVKTDDKYFVLYVPLKTNVKILDAEYFSGPYEGVNMGIFTEINCLPRISISNTNMLLDELVNGSSQVGEKWGAYSIKHIVVYRNVNTTYNIGNLLNSLSSQTGLVEVARFPNVVVFENEFAKPIVYADSPKAEVEITYHDPTSFKLQANSTAPFILIFNQVYSSGWRAWVNGSVLPETTHFEDDDGFNNWKISSTGTLFIDLYYEPQTIYIVSMVISLITVMTVLIYLVTATFAKYRHAHDRLR